MRIKSSLAAFIGVSALVLLSACAPVFSIHPYYTNKDLTFDFGLVGTWIDESDKNEKSAVIIERMDSGGTSGYSIKLTQITKQPSNPPASEEYDGYLFKLGSQEFLDAVESNVQSGDEDVLVLALPAHMLFKVSLEGDELTLSYLDDDWVKKNVESGKISIRHEAGDNETPVLTAQTDELQAFVLAHVNDKDAFSSLTPMRRRK